MSNGQNLMEDRDFLVRLFGDENDGVENAAPSRLRAASARPLRKPLAPISANVGAAHQPPSAAGKTNGRLQSASTYLNKTAHNRALPPGEAVPGRRLASASTYLISSHVPIAAAAAPPPPTTNPAQQLPKINRFKAKHAELFDALEAPKGEPRRMYTGAKTKPPTAWGTLENGQSLAGGDGSSHAPAAVASQLRGTQESLAHAHATVARDMQRAQRQLLKDGNLAVLGLPLAYLYGKPELRRYALEHVAHRLRRLAVARAHDALVHAFRTWRTPPAVRCDDRQVGLLVLAQAFQQMLDRATARAFRHWAIFYASRHNALRASVMDEAARDIQRWYRWQKQRTRDSYQRLVNALSVAVQRRRAIKYTVQMEIWARKAQLKIVRGIVHRRRRHLAARSIQRVYRWTVLYRRVMWKIIRLRAAIRIQRFWRMELARPRMDHAIFLAIARAGGYTKVTKKVPARFTAVAERGQGQGQGQRRSPPASPVRRTRLGVELPPGLLAGINACVVLIQRAWMRYAGRGAVFAELQARREQEALEMLRNDAAGVIQNSYRAHLWDRLMEAAVMHNRARRIQRAARAHQWRAAVHAFVTKRRAVRRTRARAVRERFLRRALLWAKFSLRRQALLQMELARNEATTVVARAFRRYSARVLQAQLDAVRRRAELRNSVEGLVAVVSLVQRNWRQTRETHAVRLEKRLTTNLFPRHVRLVMAALQVIHTTCPTLFSRRPCSDHPPSLLCAATGAAAAAPRRAGHPAPRPRLPAVRGRTQHRRARPGAPGPAENFPRGPASPGAAPPRRRHPRTQTHARQPPETLVAQGALSFVRARARVLATRTPRAGTARPRHRLPHPAFPPPEAARVLFRRARRCPRADPAAAGARGGGPGVGAAGRRRAHGAKGVARAPALVPRPPTLRRGTRLLSPAQRRRRPPKILQDGHRVDTVLGRGGRAASAERGRGAAAEVPRRVQRHRVLLAAVAREARAADALHAAAADAR